MINYKDVRSILLDCFLGGNYKELDGDTRVLCVEGLSTNFVLDPEKVDKHADEIKALLDQLNDNFKVSVGGGFSFLSMPFDKNNVQWGEQISAQELMVLGIAAGYMHYLLPREAWPVLPGGVPYLVIFDERQEPEYHLLSEFVNKEE